MTTMWLPRVAGAATAAYGLAVTARPAFLLGPCGWSSDDPAARALARMVGLRDAASGLALVAAPGPGAMRLAIAVRACSDLADTVVVGTTLRGQTQRAKAIAVTAGWGLLCAATAAATVRR
ncbi:hypothetical protein [Nocardia sp. NBC_01009]|uniref:hypothetical protein n=1 Tax=Nocardia sp. NBC_01009 TaxID=2975996 RepID=UPI0038657E3F|nr:hypothetical protein OHA42_35000 [Nocardia sp. NBC_01009]